MNRLLSRMISNKSNLKALSRNKEIITITNNAWSKIASILSQVNKTNTNTQTNTQTNTVTSMLFSVNGGGCNGFKYDLNIDTDNNQDKYEKYMFIEKDKNRVYIDPISELYIIGTTIDYIKEDFNKNIFESKFIFIPDKTLATNCGCGTSFTPLNH
jgi:iron-sulfur cluster insertion protein